MLVRFRLALLLFLLFCSVSTAVAEVVSVQGFTEPFYDVQLGLPEAGQVANIAVREGHLVKKGEVLLYLDKEIQELDVAQIRLKLNSNAELEYAEKRVELLRRQYESAETLFQDGAASREDFETKQLDHAEAASEAARLKMQKKLEKIELKLAKQKLQRRILTAPFSGHVASIVKEPGESVQAQEPLVRMVDAGRGRFVGSAEESVGKQFSVNQNVCLELTDSDFDPIPAQIIFLSPTIDTASGFMEIKAEFDNKEAMFRLGGSAKLFAMQNGQCLKRQ